MVLKHGLVNVLAPEAHALGDRLAVHKPLGIPYSPDVGINDTNMAKRQPKKFQKDLQLKRRGGKWYPLFRGDEAHYRGTSVPRSEPERALTGLQSVRGQPLDPSFLLRKCAPHQTCKIAKEAHNVVSEGRPRDSTQVAKECKAAAEIVCWGYVFLYCVLGVGND